MHLASTRLQTSGWWQQRVIHFLLLPSMPSSGLGSLANSQINERILPPEKALGLTALSSLSTKMGTLLDPHGRGHLIRQVSHQGPWDVCSELTGPALTMWRLGLWEADAFLAQPQLLVYEHTTSQSQAPRRRSPRRSWLFLWLYPPTLPRPSIHHSWLSRPTTFLSIWSMFYK